MAAAINNAGVIAGESALREGSTTHVALIDQHLGQASRQAGGDVDLDRLGAGCRCVRFHPPRI